MKIGKRLSEDNRFAYYEIDNRKFQVECIADGKFTGKPHFELTVFENNEFYGTYNFIGQTAYIDVLSEILSYSAIDEDDYNE